jgi:hypothetical protein
MHWVCREAEVELSEGERKGMQDWMSRAMEDADVAVQSGSVRNAAIIVNPVSGLFSALYASTSLPIYTKESR